MLTAAASDSLLYFIPFFLLFVVRVASVVGILYLAVLLMKALRKYLQSGEVRKERSAVCKSLGEALKGHRIRCHMTQEFVAERLGVSRQAVSKWENGTSDPSTSNLLALARLFDISPEELLKEVQK